MKKIIGCLLLAMILTKFSQAQTRFIVQFRDKGTNPASLSNPAGFLSQRSIDRRTRYSIPYDSTDLPVTPRYIDSVRLAGVVTIMNVSKWLNSVSIQTTDAAAITRINSLPFVRSVTSIAPRLSGIAGRDKFELEQQQLPLPSRRETGVLADFYNYGSSFSQVHIHNGEFLHNIGLRGQNMLIGMLDAGYMNYLTVPSLDSVRANGQILGTWDFVAREASVNEDNSHGMQCFSTMAANLPGQFVGTAPKANFYLFRSEDASSEYPIEEHNWVCAAERVDSLGGDLISSSVGYNQFDSPFTGFNHTYADMNGNTTMAAIGADLAAKKGILVVNSAGNEGTSTWHYIITPADGDSVMAVGAVNGSGVFASFSSYGPSSDGQVKPDVASVGQGTIVQYPNNSIAGGSGTSFSAPNIAGLTTCLWQGFQEYNNIKIISALRQAGSRYSNPNDSIGYGIPDVKKAVMNLLKEFAVSSVSVSNCRATINWTSKDMKAMKYEIERKLPGEINFTKIAEQMGTGTIFGTRPAYQYQDVLSGLNSGTITYRIRQIIDTATTGFTADYISTATVNLTTSCDPVISTAISVSPNPTYGQFKVKISTPDAIQNLVIRIIDSKGAEVYLAKKSKPAGTISFDIPAFKLAKGKYYVVVYNNNSVMETKELIRL